VITLRTKKVFDCKCIACGHEWSADKKPGRCSSCKSRRWNGEDHRFQNPYNNKNSNVPLKQQIRVGTLAPSGPNSAALLDTLTSAKLVVEEILNQQTYKRADLKKLLPEIEGHIERLTVLRRSASVVNA
jgi:hypothetical protein